MYAGMDFGGATVLRKQNRGGSASFQMGPPIASCHTLVSPERSIQVILGEVQKHITSVSKRSGSASPRPAIGTPPPLLPSGRGRLQRHLFLGTRRWQPSCRQIANSRLHCLCKSQEMPKAMSAFGTSAMTQATETCQNTRVLFLV